MIFDRMYDANQPQAVLCIPIVMSRIITGNKHQLKSKVLLLLLYRNINGGLLVFFRSTVNGENYQINTLLFSGKVCQLHQESVHFIAHSAKNSTSYKMFSER